MIIACPHCRFSKDVNQQWIPRNPSQVECPKCDGKFYFSHEEGVCLTPPEPPVPKVTCPSCGLEQPAGETCGGCGIVFAKWEKRKLEREHADDPFFAEPAFAEDGVNFTIAEPANAGFWIRVAAVLLDSLVLIAAGLVVDIVIGKVFGVQGTLLGTDLSAPAAKTGKLIGNLIGIFYFVLFTAFGGQTLGKKVVGIKVVRMDCGEVGFWRALLRETIGKILAMIILCIGYLMAAFHPRKRGLHDYIAGTQVISL